MKWIFRDKKGAVIEPLEVGLLGVVIPASTMTYAARDRVSFCAISTGLRLDEVERRILALEGKGDAA